jgi:hypothetical protein
MIKYIRDENIVYERVDGTDQFRKAEEFKSISAAKHWTNAKEKAMKGCVRRRQSLEISLGPTKVKEMLSGK